MTASTLGLRMQRRGVASPLVVRVVPVSERVALQRELQYHTYVYQAGLHCPEPIVSDVVFTSTIACIVMGYIEGQEAITPDKTAMVGRGLAKSHTLPFSEFATQKSVLGLQLASRGIVPEEIDTSLVADPWELADRLRLEDLPTGPAHGDFMPNNALITGSGAAILDFGNAGRDCLGVDVARHCLGLSLTYFITEATLLFESFLKGSQSCSHSTTC